MKVVIDTNVLVSGLLSPYGICSEIVRWIPTKIFELCVDVRIVLEYEEVLKRQRFGFNPESVDILLGHIRAEAFNYLVYPSLSRLPDPDDEAFLEVAVAAKADYLVTGNIKHFPEECRAGISVVLPKQFYDIVRS